jgi:hypothetical protein
LGKTIALRFEIVRFLKKPALYASKMLNFKLTLPSLVHTELIDNFIPLKLVSEQHWNRCVRQNNMYLRTTDDWIGMSEKKLTRWVLQNNICIDGYVETTAG